MSFSVFSSPRSMVGCPSDMKREKEREKEKGQKRREGESEHCPKLFVQPRSEVFPLSQKAGSTTCAKSRLNLLPTIRQCASFASCIEWHEFVRCIHSSLPIHISHQPTVAHRGYHGQIRTWRRVRPGCERWGDSSHRRCRIDHGNHFAAPTNTHGTTVLLNTGKASRSS
jgi:hypothetical protein